MDNLKKYLKQLSIAEKHDFATSCGTTLNALRVAMCKKRKLNPLLAIEIEKKSNKAVKKEELRPDVWTSLSE